MSEIKAWMLGDDTWTKEGQYRVLRVAGTKLLQEYIENRQVTLAEWVDLRPIFEVCSKETGYKGGEKLRDLLWR